MVGIDWRQSPDFFMVHSKGSRMRAVGVLLSTIFASSMGFLSPSMINIAGPSIQEVLGASAPQLLWIANGETLMLACLILVGGALGDRYGRKRIFGIGVVIFTCAAFLCGLTGSVWALIALRVVQGIGGAMMIPGSLALIAANFDESKRGGAIGIWSAATSASILGGPIVGGALVNAGLWRGVFFIHVPLAVVALIPLLIWVPESRDEDKKQRLDWLGVVLVTGALFLISYGAIEAGRTSLDIRTALFIVAGLVLFALFILLESKSSNPLLPLRIFRSRQFLGANLFTVFIYGALQSTLFLYVLNLIQIQNYNPLFVGLAILPSTAQLVVLSPLAGKLADRFGTRPLLSLGAFITGIGMIGLGFPGVTAGSVDFWRSYFVPMLCIGFGMSMVVAPLSTSVMNSSDPQLVGTASGVNNAISRAAGVLAIAVIGALMLTLYSGSIATAIAPLDLGTDASERVLAEAQNLGNAQVPEGVPERARAAIEDIFRQSFVKGFRRVAFVGGALSWLSALIAVVFVQSKSKSKNKKRTHT